jgi:hypothetical protein
MGILDEAIKEHLELKRQHGAGESELKQLEGEAFGAAERPGDEEPTSDALAEAPTAFMAQPDLAEAEAPAEEATAMEHEAVPVSEAGAGPDLSVGPTTEEREAIAEHPTEMYDVEEEIAAQEREAPSEEELVEQEVSEPRLAPVDPLASVEEAEGDEVEVTDAREEGDADLDDEFWDEKRLSDELDEALEAPVEPEVSAKPEPELSAKPEAEAAEPLAEGEPDSEDVLEETPDFLEEAPEDDQLWFEQKPPKDFDFDD